MLENKIIILYHQMERSRRMELTKLKGKLVELKKTYEDCAKVLGISITAFNNKMNGDSTFKLPEVNKLCEYLGLSDEEKVRIFLD